RVPAHVGHVEEEYLDPIGILLGSIGDDLLHQAMSGQGRFPGEGLVDALWVSRLVHQEVLGAGDEAKGRSRQRLTGLHLARLARRADGWRRRLGVGRLVEEAPRYVDAPQQQLQDVKQPAGLEAVR